MSRVLYTIELEGDAVLGDRVVLRDETGGERAAVSVPSHVHGEDVASDLCQDLMEQMRTIGRPEDDEQ